MAALAADRRSELCSPKGRPMEAEHAQLCDFLAKVGVCVAIIIGVVVSYIRHPDT
jgi:hypothetical protein